MRAVFLVAAHPLFLSNLEPKSVDRKLTTLRSPNISLPNKKLGLVEHHKP